jgi:sulfane dehydrogenase subunit SoxC
MIALYQNGERINPAQGYPMRLLVPGYEGNMNVKWLHRIKLIEEPVMAINETLQYTYRVAGPKIWQFFFPMEVKSFITHPSPGLTLKGGPGFYEIARPCLFRQWADRQGHGLGRWRQELGAGGA